jgi:hypothetical protein
VEVRRPRAQFRVQDGRDRRLEILFEKALLLIAELSCAGSKTAVGFDLGDKISR